MLLKSFKHGDKLIEINVTEVARQMIDNGFADGEPIDGWTQTLLENTTEGALFETTVSEEVKRLSRPARRRYYED